MTGLQFFKLKFFIFITDWALVLQLVAFIRLGMSDKINEFNRRLLIMSWSIGWMISLMFWIYIFPIVNLKELPPAWHYISTHGGVHGFFVYEFLQSTIKISKADFKWPVLVLVIYFFFMVLPLKFVGITIYPLFFEEVIPTVVILLGSVLVLWLTFYAGLYLQNRKVKGAID